MSIRSQKSGNAGKLIRTFTYFIPSPPNRKNGYREKEYDKIMNGILQSGFELVQFQTQAVESGLFVFAVIKGNKKLLLLDKDLDIQDRFKLSHSHSSPEFTLDDDE